MAGVNRRTGSGWAVGLPGLLRCGHLAGCIGPPVLSDCQPKRGLTPVCIFQGPEDLAVVGDGLVVSQRPPATNAEGSADDDGGCSAGRPPTVADFARHGIDVSGTRLLAIDHRREAIEEFALELDGNLWIGAFAGDRLVRREGVR